jgi:peptidoglycan DL-endopeptidase LytE
MKTWALTVPAACLLFVLAIHAEPFVQGASAPPGAPDSWDRIKATIESYLGRPYVWGATGLKSFDCSGFVWRVLNDNGILMKRTTARKLYFSLPKPGEGATWSSGNIVFFDDLRHCGIVNDRQSFYHAGVTLGTTLSRFHPFWQVRIVGIRCPPQPEIR